MTALTIIPDYGKKRLKLVGTVAAGEHVSVRVIGGAEWIQPGEDAEGQTLRLRVLFGGHTVAMFPRPEQPDADPSEPTDEWSEDPEDPSDAACELNLNSIPAEKLLRCGGECLCILDDPVNHTMYGAGEFRVEPWPKMRPADEPYSLDDYPDFVQEAKDAIAAAQTAIEEAVDEASGIVAQAQSAKTVATDAAATATGSANAAAGSAGLAANSASAAASSASNASAAATAAEEARDSIQPPVDPLTQEEVEDGRAADAASTGAAVNAVSDLVGRNAERIAKNADDIETAVGLLRSHASGATEVAGNPIHVSKQDRLNWNAKLDPAAVMQFVDGAALGTGDHKNILYLKHGDTVVAQVNMARFAIDGMVDNVEIDDGNLVITFNTEAGKQPISIPLTDIFNPANYYDKMAVDARFVQKEAGKGLSTNDYTDADKAKVDNAATVAVVDSKIAGKRDKTDLKVYDGAAAWDLSVVQALYPSLTIGVAVGAYISASGMKYKWFISGDGSAMSASEEMYDTEAAANAATQFTAEGSSGYPELAGVVVEKRATAGTDTLATKADATLTERGFSEWTLTPSEVVFNDVPWELGQPFWTDDEWHALGGPGWYVNQPASEPAKADGSPDKSATSLSFYISDTGDQVSATRTALPGYQLGSDTDHILASEAEAEALRQGKQDVLTFDNTPTAGSNNPVKSGGIWSAIWGALAALPTGFSSLYDWCASRFAGKLDATSAAPAFSESAARIYAVGDHCTYNGKVYTCIVQTTGGTWNASCWGTTKLIKPPLLITPGNLAAFGIGDDGTTLDDSGIAVQDVARAADLHYSLGTPIVINTASSETVEGETVYYGAATLANRTANIVQVTAATPLDELRITFPAATSGKVRDFGLRVEIGTGDAALTAPALVPVAPSGETITLENADGAIPALADGTATAKGVTLLYFSETAPGVFVVKGEQVEEVA